MSGSNITAIASDALLRILGYLDAESLAKQCCTCRDLKAAAETPSLWKALVEERWHHPNVAAFAAAQHPLPAATTVSASAIAQADAVADVDWKSLFISGNGWEPPILRHATLCHNFGVSADALSSLWLAASHDPLDDRTYLSPDGSSSGRLLLAVASTNGLEVRHINTSRTELAPDDQDATRNAVTVIPINAGACSVTWIEGADCVNGGGGDEKPVGSGKAAVQPPPRGDLPLAATTAPSSSAAATAAVVGAAARGRTLTLAVGTGRGTVDWYTYDVCTGTHSDGALASRSLSGNDTVLRWLSSTPCGSSEPLKELHYMAAGSGSGVGGVGGGLLAALQRARIQHDWHTSRSAVQLYDVATRRHVSTVRDPFESHCFVCCCPAAAAAGADVDPHVLLVGSAHRYTCVRCAEMHLPSLCSHKPRSATAALYTLDVRCGGGGSNGLTQRFGLAHCSLYPRIATAREYYVFTSHAGTALEVYDRRDMSVPLYTCARMVWHRAADDGIDQHDEDDDGYAPAAPLRKTLYHPPGWRDDGPSSYGNRHQALCLVANDDVLLGRSDNGTVWMWDLSTTLGWARGPDRSGLWHWIYEHGLLQPADEEQAAVAAAAAAAAAGVQVAAGCQASGSASETSAHGSRAQSHGAVRAAAAPGAPMCLGSLPSHGSTPLLALATGPSTAILNSGADVFGGRFLVASVTGLWPSGLR